MPTEKDWKKWENDMKKWVIQLCKWQKENPDKLWNDPVTAESGPGSNPPPPPTPPPGKD